MKNLRGKTMVITGAGSGIGRALALESAGLGMRLALLDIDGVGLEETRRMCGDKSESTIFRADVSKREDMFRVCNEITGYFGQVDILINNAGVSSSGMITDLSFETLEWTININLWGVINGTLAFLPHLLARPEAVIVNVSSVYGLLGVPAQAAYCCSKFAVRGFTEAIRQDLRQTGVSVVLVIPGGVKTNIVKNSRSDSPLPDFIKVELAKRFEGHLKTTSVVAAKAIIKGIKNKSPRVLIGQDAKAIDWLARLRPESYDNTIARVTAKLLEGIDRPR